MRHPLYVLIAGAMGVTAIGLFLAVPALVDGVASHYTLGFSDDYDEIGANIAEGHGYRLRADLGETMMREPLYPLFLAGLFALLGHGIEAARLGNLLLAGAVALFLWHLARRVARDDAVALVAVAIFLLHPGTLIAQARGGVEVLFMCAALGFMLLLYRALESDKAMRYALAGLALGAVVLIRSTPLVFPLVLLPYLALTAPPGGRLRRLALGGVLVGAMMVAMAPWVARNYALSGAFVPTATVQGVAIQEGQYTCERLSFGRNFRVLQNEAAAERDRLAAQAGMKFRGPFFQYFHRVADEVAFNRLLLDAAFARYRQDPGLLARCSAANVLHFWFLGKNGVSTALNVALQLPLLLLALAGWWTLSRRVGASNWAPVVLFGACLVAVHLPILAHARHGVPLVPFVAIFAATALVALWRRSGMAVRPALSPSD